MIRSFRPLGALTVLLLTAAPAMAANNFRMPTDAKIDLVRDLPNEDPFEHDGQFYDLGYLYSTERVNGADVARTGQGFVLYHDDRYIKLDADKLSMVTMALGEDPTKDYVPPVATRPATAGGSGDAARDGNGEPMAGQPAPDRPAARRGSGATGIVLAIFVFGFLLILRLMTRAAVRAMLSPMLGRRTRQPLAIASADPFESRVSARLAEIENQAVASGSASAPRPSYQPQSVAAAPVVRGFGRKGL